MLTTVIDEVVLPQAERFTRDLKKVGKHAERDKFISVDDVAKQTIYLSTLQMKAYFSLLEDISGMYTEIDKSYIGPGMELCDRLSAGSASTTPIEQLSQQLYKYSQDSAKAVAALVSNVSSPSLWSLCSGLSLMESEQRQQEVLKGLKDRAKKAAETSEVIENTVRAKGLPIDETSKDAIDKGTEEAKQETQTMVNGDNSATALHRMNEERVLDE